MKILTLLLHDERFSGWTLKNKLNRHHFSIDYLRFYRQSGSKPLLYTFHERLTSPQDYEVPGAGLVKVFPVDFRFPPFLRFGNDHSPLRVLKEMVSDRPDVVHFHNYYLLSYPYVSEFVAKRLKIPLITQLHGYNNHSLRKWLYLACLMSLRNANKILYSYAPERNIYQKLGLLDKAVRLPIPGVDPSLFKPKRFFNTNRMLYIGRIPSPETANGEKSPFLLLYILKKLTRKSKDIRLDIVGDGPGMRRSQMLTKSLGISKNVIFHGYVPHADLAKYYQASTLTFSPIQVYDVDGWFDGSIQESLACRTPVAAFKSTPEAPLQGTYGFLLSTNLERAAAELNQLLRRPEQMNEPAASGSEFVRRECSYEQVVSKLKNNLESVMN